MREHILLLAGTHEARLLARDLAGNPAQPKVTASFAGAVTDLPDLGVPTRIGGFGGADGLAAYLKQEAVSVLIDATHPFAAQMSRNAVLAAGSAGIPLLRLERPKWSPVEGDTWQPLPTLAAAADALPTSARVFLSVGRKEIGVFSHRTDLFGLARMIEPPGLDLPGHWHLVLARPSQSVEDEVRLLETHRISHMVTKNSGGTRAHAKIAAARLLNLPVLMIERPHVSGGTVFRSRQDLLAGLERVRGRHVQ